MLEMIIQHTLYNMIIQHRLNNDSIVLGVSSQTIEYECMSKVQYYLIPNMQL